MQKCPKCGYSEGFDWPGLFLFLAVVVMSLGVEFLSTSKRSRFLCLAVVSFLVVVSFVWRSAKDDRNRVEHLKSTDEGQLKRI